MYLYNPPNLPEVDVYYFVVPGQKKTFDDPVFEAYVEFDHIEINGKHISLDLDILLTEKWGKKWEKEILNGQNKKYNKSF